MQGDAASSSPKLVLVMKAAIVFYRSCFFDFIADNWLKPIAGSIRHLNMHHRAFAWRGIDLHGSIISFEPVADAG